MDLWRILLHIPWDDFPALTADIHCRVQFNAVLVDSLDLAITFTYICGFDGVIPLVRLNIRTCFKFSLFNKITNSLGIHPGRDFASVVPKAKHSVDKYFISTEFHTSSAVVVFDTLTIKILFDVGEFDFGEVLAGGQGEFAQFREVVVYHDFGVDREGQEAEGEGERGGPNCLVYKRRGLIKEI